MDRSNFKRIEKNITYCIENSIKIGKDFIIRRETKSVLQMTWYFRISFFCISSWKCAGSWRKESNIIWKSKKRFQIDNEYTPNYDIWGYVRGKCHGLTARTSFDRRHVNVVKNVLILFPTKIWSKLLLSFDDKGIRALTIDKDNAPKVYSLSLSATLSLSPSSFMCKTPLLKMHAFFSLGIRIAYVVLSKVKNRNHNNSSVSVFLLLYAKLH